MQTNKAYTHATEQNNKAMGRGGGGGTHHVVLTDRTLSNFANYNIGRAVPKTSPVARNRLKPMTSPNYNDTAL